MSTSLIVLAAGKGTRMRSELPKVLHKVAGFPLLAHALKSGAAVSPERRVIVTGHGAKLVESAAMQFDENAVCVEQEHQLGTGHAVLQARAALEDFDGNVIVLYGDTPFIRPETLEKMAQARKSHDVVVLGFKAADPAKYGRLVMEGEALLKIVEFSDATAQERAIDFCNSGVVAASARTLFELLDRVGNDNASGEFYLTDIVALAREAGLSATAVGCDEAETLGVNSRSDLARAENSFQQSARAAALDSGITMSAPDTVYFAMDTVIGPDTEIEPNVVFGPGVTVENGARIRAFCHLEGAHVSRGAIVGPYARLRPGAELSENVHVGNFVEIKNAVLEEGAKANHLTYLGDARVGEGTNIGAGTITCNYDGVFKHKTDIGKRVFIGSNTMLVAPITVGDEAMTASGAVVTKDVPEGALAVARAHQINKPGLAKKLFDKLRSRKARQAEEKS